MENRWALVTGAGTRVGQTIAIGLARGGYDVIVHYFSSAKGAERTVSEVMAVGRKAFSVQADLRKTDSPKMLLKEIEAKVTKLELLVNNASTYPEPERAKAAKSLLEETPEDWELSLNVNARAPFFLIQQLAPLLSASGEGQVVNILDSSVSAPFLSRASHSVSKSALAAITKIAAETLAPKVRVNALELGSILAPVGRGDEPGKVWIGTQGVVDALLQLIADSGKNGEIVRVG